VGRDEGGKDLLFGLEVDPRFKGMRGLDDGMGFGGFFTRGSGTIGCGVVSKSPNEGMVILGEPWNLLRSIFPILLKSFEADGDRGKGVTDEEGNGEM
jgi:hypothetical protein